MCSLQSADRQRFVGAQAVIAELSPLLRALGAQVKRMHMCDRICSTNNTNYSKNAFVLTVITYVVQSLNLLSQRGNFNGMEIILNTISFISYLLYCAESRRAGMKAHFGSTNSLLQIPSQASSHALSCMPVVAPCATRDGLPLSPRLLS